MHCVQIDSVNARTTPSRWTLLNSYRFPSAHRDAQVTVQRVLARTLAGGITPPQVVSLRLPRYLICRPYARHHVVRPSLGFTEKSGSLPMCQRSHVHDFLIRQTFCIGRPQTAQSIARSFEGLTWTIEYFAHGNWGMPLTTSALRIRRLSAAPVRRSPIPHDSDSRARSTLSVPSGWPCHVLEQAHVPDVPYPAHIHIQASLPYCHDTSGVHRGGPSARRRHCLTMDIFRIGSSGQTRYPQCAPNIVF